MEPTLKEKNIIEVIDSNYLSLKSHAQDIVCPMNIPKKWRYKIGGKDFDKKCIKEYANNIKKLADIL